MRLDGVKSGSSRPSQGSSRRTKAGKTQAGQNAPALYRFTLTRFIYTAVRRIHFWVSLRSTQKQAQQAG